MHMQLLKKLIVVLLTSNSVDRVLCDQKDPLSPSLHTCRGISWASNWQTLGCLFQGEGSLDIWTSRTGDIICTHQLAIKAATSLPLVFGGLLLLLHHYQSLSSCLSTQFCSLLSISSSCNGAQLLSLRPTRSWWPRAMPCPWACSSLGDTV